MKGRALVFAFVALAIPAFVEACPVCFGATDSSLLDAAQLGVLALFALTATVLVAFGRWFLKLRALQQPDEDRS